MILQMQKNSFDSEKADIIFPMTLAEVRTEMRGLEEFGKHYDEVRIVRGKGPARVLNGRMGVDDLNTEAGIQKLNQLAEILDNMSGEKLKLLNGALNLERAENLDDVLCVIASLERYEMFPQITTDEELAHFLMDTAAITGSSFFPKEVLPYLDYAKLGAEQRNILGGIHTFNGFIKRREEAPAQAEVPRTMLLTLTTSEKTYPLVLPATEEQLKQAKQVLGVEDFSQVSITSVSISSPHLADMLPLDTITVEAAGTLAQCLQEMKQEDGALLKYHAVLEAERPGTFSEAVTIAMDRDNYEQVPDDMEEYGKQVLRRIGADDEILDTIDGFMDFAGLGRLSMEEDGVRRTEFGLVRRVSQPFPPQQEIGQQMM